MSRQEAFAAFMETINSQPLGNFAAAQVAALMDLTLLDPNAPAQAFAVLNAQARLHALAAVCVFPEHLQFISIPTNIKIATVVNFPQGNQSTKAVLGAIDHLLSHHQIDEIDYVFPYQDYLAGRQSKALSQCQAVYQLCQQQGLLLKIIIESGALPSTEFVYQLSRKLIDQGCDFLKTSTGKITQGASPAAAFAMLQAIKDSTAHCGLKISGGIKTPAQAFLYMAIAKSLLDKEPDKSWFRIGASSLLNRLYPSSP